MKIIEGLPDMVEPVRIPKELSGLSELTGIPESEFEEAIENPNVPEKICYATTVDKAREEFLNAKSGSRSRHAAFNRWNRLSLTEVRKASNILDARKAHDRAPKDSRAERAAIKKWIGFCRTTEDALEAYNHALSDSPARQVALLKWISLCATIGQAQKAYRYAPSGSDASHAALEKWVSLCETIGEARRAYHNAPIGSDARRIALLKMNEIYQNE